MMKKVFRPSGQEMNQLGVDYSDGKDNYCNQMTFIEFQKPFKAKSKKPRITIRPSGSISFNVASAKIIKKEGDGFLVFMFDRDTNQIGFKPASKNDDYSYPLQEANGAYKATAIAFLKRYGIDYSNGSKNYPAKWNEQLGMLIVQL